MTPQPATPRPCQWLPVGLLWAGQAAPAKREHLGILLKCRLWHVVGAGLRRSSSLGLGTGLQEVLRLGPVGHFLTAGPGDHLAWTRLLCKVPVTVQCPPVWLPQRETR